MTARVFIEQTVGLGIIVNFFTLDDIWYVERTGGGFRYGGPNFGLAPAATLGGGIDISRENKRTHLLWIRPTVYWNLAMRGVHLPYGAVQAGYSIRIRGGK